MRSLPLLLSLGMLTCLAPGALAQTVDDTAQPLPAPAAAPITGQAVLDASLDSVPVRLQPAQPDAPAPQPDPAIVKLQVLLDRAGASPGVIDGFDGENVRKALMAFETMHGLPPDGQFDADIASDLPPGGNEVGIYTITQEDVAAVEPPIPQDYALQAQRQSLGYASVQEELAERFHMDEDLLVALNPNAGFSPGEQVVVTDPGMNVTGEVERIEADKSLRQVRAYAADGTLLAAYPSTIGSAALPSPSGTYTVEAVAPNPTYTYNPKLNFQQGSNTKVLTLPPGPNNPVGSTWIDLSKPTYGIHGTPEPSLIDKTASHGCVRLTNWDAAELASMVSKGVTVTFVGQDPSASPAASD